MDIRQSLALQLHFNASFVAILDGRVEALIAELRADPALEMKVEIQLLKQIYEKFIEAKPLIEALQDQGRKIYNAKAN